MVALILLIVLVIKGPFKIEQIQLVLSQKKILLLGFGLLGLQMLLFSARWMLFTKQVTSLNFSKILKLSLIGQFFSFFIPGGVSGDVVKALELAHKTKISRTTALSTVLADRVFGLFAMILLSAIFLLAEFLEQPTPLIQKFLLINTSILFVLTIGLLITPYLVKHLEVQAEKYSSSLLKKILKLIDSLSLTFTSFRNYKIQLRNFVVCSAAQLITVTFIYEVVKALNVSPPAFFVFFALCCFGFLVIAIPITPAGIGVGQTALYFLFSTFSHEMGQAAVTALSLFQLFTLFYALFGGLLFSIKTKQTKVSTYAETKN